MATAEALVPATVESSEPRLPVVDVLRGVAGLAATVFLLSPQVTEEGGVPLLHGALLGRPGPLFGIIAGISLTVGRRLHSGPERARAVGHRGRGLAIRFLFVLSTGLLLGLLGGTTTSFFVAIGACGLMCGSCATRLPDRALLVVITVVAVGGPVVSMALRGGLGLVALGHSPSFDDLRSSGQALRLLTDVVLTGPAPVLPWVAYPLIGVALGRLTIADKRTAITMTIGGLAAWWTSAGLSHLVLVLADGRDSLVESVSRGYGVSSAEAAFLVNRLQGTGMQGTPPPYDWWWLASDAPNSTTTFDILRSAGIATMVCGVVLLLRSVLADQVARVLAMLGQASLSLQCALLATVLPLTPDDGEPFGTWPVVIAAVVVEILLAYASIAWFRRGPLEWVQWSLLRITDFPAIVLHRRRQAQANT